MQFSQEIRERSRDIRADVESRIRIPAEHRDAALYPSHAEALIASVLGFAPSHTLEIGLGWGLSAASILAAGSGDHTVVSFDEDEGRQHQGIDNACMFGKPAFAFGPSDIVLPQLLSQHREHFDLILIDGGHLFDEVFVDVHYSLQLCRVGGLILIDDTWMAPVSTACAWIQSNLCHAEQIASVDCMSIYRKLGSDNRIWTHWHPFPVTQQSKRPE